MLSDVSKTASTQSLLLYSGKRSGLFGKIHTLKIEKSFTRGKFNKGRSLNMDSFYNSFELARQLLRDRTYFTETMSTGRVDIPADIKSAKLKKRTDAIQGCRGCHVRKVT